MIWPEKNRLMGCTNKDSNFLLTISQERLIPIVLKTTVTFIVGCSKHWKLAITMQLFPMSREALRYQLLEEMERI